MDFEHSLLCCEEFSSSPMMSGVADTSSPSSASPSSSCMCSPYSTMSVFSPDDDDDLTVAFLVRKQEDFITDKSYSAELQSRPALCDARCNAVRWMIKAHFIHKFSPVTVAMAVNYMDRYLQQNFSLPWKAWMMDLLSVACFSVAAKMEEVNVPALLDLQVEGMEHLFQPKTVQRMELNVLGSIRWKLRCVTPFTFAEKAINHFDVGQYLKSSLLMRASELLLGTLAEAKFLDFDPTILASTSICSALEELLPLQSDQLKLSLLKYISLDEEMMRRCSILMEALIVDPFNPTVSLNRHTKSPLSPNTVMYNFEDGSSADSTGHHFQLVPKLLVERLDLHGDNASSPKRQRRI